MEHFIFKLKPKDYIKILKFFKLKKNLDAFRKKKNIIYIFLKILSYFS